MPAHRTYENYVGIAEDDTAFGTYKAPAWYLPLDTIPDPNYVREKLDAITKRQHQTPHVADVEEGYEDIDITIGGYVPVITTDPGFLYVLKHAFGKVTLGDADPVFTHVFEITKNNPALGLSVTVGLGDQRRVKMAGCRISNFKISGDVSSMIRWEATLIGRYIGQDATMDDPSWTERATHPVFFTGQYGTFTYVSGECITNYESNLVNAIGRDKALAGCLGYNYPKQLAKLGTTYTGKIVRRWTPSDGAADSIFREDCLAQVDRLIELIWNGIAIPGGGGEEYTFQVETNVLIPPDKVPRREENAGVLTESAEFEGRWDETNEIIKITTKTGCNTPATYNADA